MLCCCFTQIVFIELNFTVALLLIRGTWDDRFARKMGSRGGGRWMGFLRNGEDPSNGEMILRWVGVDTPVQTMITIFEN